jgi:protocatechuate 3,4-dioxygenase beta subunit
MTKRTVGIVLGLVAVALGLWLWKGRGDDRAATPTGTTAGGGSAGRGHVRTADGPTSGIDAIVVGANGEPVAGAVARVGGADQDDAPARATGADGKVSFDVPAGHYRVTAPSKDRLPGEAVVDVPAGGRVTAELRLGAAAPVLRGQVTDMSGGAIEGAIVRIARQHGGLTADTDRAAAAITDASGNFAAAIAPGRYEVATHHSEYLDDERPVEIGPAGGELSIQLAPGAVIEGVVVDRQRGPAGGAQVTWQRELVNRGRFTRRVDAGQVEAGPDGTFRITGLGAGRIALQASTEDGRESVDPVEVEVGIAETATGVEVAVSAPAQPPAIVGKVVNPDDSPASRATVMYMSPSGISGVSTDERGAFQLRGLVPGTYKLFAVAPELLESPQVSVEVGAAPVPPVTLVLASGAFITGRVEPPGPADIEQDMTDTEGILGRDLSALARGDLRVRTEPDGTFRIGPFAPGEVPLLARAADGRKGRARVTVPATGDVVITLEDHGAIAGRVVDQAGKPIAGAVVNLRLREARRTMVVNGLDVSADRAPTDATGAFRIAGREAGTWDLTVLDGRGTRLPFGKGKADAPVRVTVAEGEQKDGVELVVEASTGVIRGKVVDTAGAAVADAWVTVAPASRGWLPGGGDVPAPDDDGPGERSHSVVVMSTGSPMAGDVPPVLTGPDGSFAIGGLRRGAYDVTAEGLRGSARGTLPGVAVERDPVDVHVVVVALATIEGTVASAGKPVTGFELALDGPTGKDREVNDPRGAFSVKNLDAGRYTLTATAPEGTGVATVDVQAGKTARATIELVSDGRVVGKLVDAAGAPLADRVVLLLPRQEEGKMSASLSGPPPQTAADGAFVATGPAGPRTLLIMGDQGPLIRRDFDLESGKTVDLGTLKPDPPRVRAGGGAHKPAG